MDKHALREAGLKATSQRLSILSIMAQSETRHLSAEDIYKHLLEAGEDVGIATVYRVLVQFEQAGLIVRHNFDDNHAVFELNEGEHHDHLVCVKCNVVKEFVDDVIEGRQQQIAQRAGFQMTDHSLNIYGICSACQ